VRGNVMEGVAKKKAILDRYNELAANYSDETADEMTKLQDEIEAQGLWDLDSKVDQAMDALRCPKDDANVASCRAVSAAAWRCAGCCWTRPTLLLDEPTNHLDAESVEWLEGHCAGLSRRVILIVTHDRYFLDNVTSWILELDRGKGIPYEGNYSSWLGRSRSALSRNPRGSRAPAHARARTRMDRGIAQGAPGQVQGALSAL
jgi:ATPase subunit of ABC transporter with duplicated ATPase domains